MPEFKVNKGASNFRKLPVENWTTDNLCQYFQAEFKRKYGVETRRPIGQIKCHINQKTVTRLFRMEGRSTDVHPNELFRQFIDHLLDLKTVKNMRVWYFSKEEIMCDFLDNRAKAKLDAKFGTVEDAKREEEERIKRALDFYGKGNK